MGRMPNRIGDDAILYLRNVPATAPTPSKINSIPFIFQIAYHNLTQLIGIISILIEAV
jgi:hypothetical protein